MEQEIAPSKQVVGAHFHLNIGRHAPPYMDVGHEPSAEALIGVGVGVGPPRVVALTTLEKSDGPFAFRERTR